MTLFDLGGVQEHLNICTTLKALVTPDMVSVGNSVGCERLLRTLQLIEYLLGGAATQAGGGVAVDDR